MKSFDGMQAVVIGGTGGIGRPRWRRWWRRTLAYAWYPASADKLEKLKR